jgi:tetratricopeptide (TPR) repeat protein
VKLSYFGTADPAYYKLPVQMLPSAMRPQPDRVCLFVRPGDVIAISATNLQGVYLPRSVTTLLTELRSRQPFERAGYSILLYRADFSWLMDPEAADELGWLADAVRSYRQATVLDPGWAEAHGHLGAALELQQRHGRALLAFADAVRLDPSYFERWPTQRRLAERARARAAPRSE